MTDPKDSNLSPIGRKWDNTLVERRKWRLERAALYGLAGSVALFAIDTLVGEVTGHQKPFAADPISFVVRVGILPLIFVIVAAFLESIEGWGSFEARGVAEPVMGILEDVMKVLDRIPVWKRLQEVPAEVDQLKAKIAALEEMLGGKWPADVCKYCGERAARLSLSIGPDAKGNVRQEWHCPKCNNTEVRLIKP